MTYMPIAPWQHRMMGELLDQFERMRQPRAFMHKSQLIVYDEFPVHDPAQRDPPKKRHHDHLIQRHIRSVRRN